MTRIEDESARMGVLVEDLLALARLDEVREQVREPVDLARWRATRSTTPARSRPSARSRCTAAARTTRSSSTATPVSCARCSPTSCATRSCTRPPARRSRSRCARATATPRSRCATTVPACRQTTRASCFDRFWRGDGPARPRARARGRRPGPGDRRRRRRGARRARIGRRRRRRRGALRGRAAAARPRRALTHRLGAITSLPPVLKKVLRRGAIVVVVLCVAAGGAYAVKTQFFDDDERRRHPARAAQRLGPAPGVVRGGASLRAVLRRAAQALHGPVAAHDRRAQQAAEQAGEHAEQGRAGGQPADRAPRAARDVGRAGQVEGVSYTVVSDARPLRGWYTALPGCEFEPVRRAKLNLDRRRRGGALHRCRQAQLAQARLRGHARGAAGHRAAGHDAPSPRGVDGVAVAARRGRQRLDGHRRRRGQAVSRDVGALELVLSPVYGRSGIIGYNRVRPRLNAC